MRLYRDLDCMLAPSAVAIGTFDGVHVGHQAIIATTAAAARSRGLQTTVVTFEPSPRSYFDPPGAPARLTTLAEKLTVFRSLGVDNVVALRFGRRLATLPPQAFIDLLADHCGARWLMVGEDFRFGAGRSGGIAELRAAGRFEVLPMTEVLAAGTRVSSSRIRSCLGEGDLMGAEALLGRPYTITGHVVHGDRLGRTIGFPTANVALGRARRAKPPLFGVYAVKLQGIQGLPVAFGAASLGRNPAVKVNGPPSLEVHVFDFAGNLYARKVTVQFCLKLRDEAHYPTLESLTAAIRADCARAREFFQT